MPLADISHNIWHSLKIVTMSSLEELYIDLFYWEVLCKGGKMFYDIQKIATAPETLLIISMNIRLLWWKYGQTLLK